MMRTAKDVLNSLEISYSVDTGEYNDGLSDKKCESMIIDNYLGTQLIIADVLEDYDVIGYDVDFFDSEEAMYLDGYRVESEQELEDIISGFTG